MEFGTILSQHRRTKRLSQQMLADISGVSQRHISFLESGRSMPGRQSIRQLIDGLGLSKSEAQTLLAAAGLAVGNAVLDWESPQFAQARDAANLLLLKHEPFPALVCDRSGEVLQMNDAFRRTLAFADAGNGRLGTLAHNLFDLTLHPDGLVGLMVNPHEIVPHTIHRLKAAAISHAGAAKILARVRRYPCISDYCLAAWSSSHGVLTEHYRFLAHDIRIISLTAAFGCPEDEIAQHIQFELFLPADADSREVLTGLSIVSGK